MSGRPGQLRRRAGSSIQGRLILLVLAVALPLLGLAGAAVWDAYASERARAEERLQGRARAMAVLVDREIGRAEALLRTAERSGALQAEDRATLLARTAAVAEELGAWVGFASREGTAAPLAVWPETTPPPGPEGAGTIAAALATGRPAVSPLIHDAGPGTPDPIIVVAVPVRGTSGDAGSQLALAAALPASLFVHVLSELDLPKGWIGTLVDADGVIAARTLRPGSTIGLPATPPLLDALARQSGTTGLVQGVPTFEGERAIAAFARVPRGGYTAYILVPEGVFTAPLRAAMARTVAIGSGLALLGLGLAALVARRIARALQSLLASPRSAVGSSGFREVDEIAARLAAADAESARAGAALSESEARFRGTFEQAAVGIAHVALDGRWLRVNDRICEIVGYPAGTLLTMTFQDITHPDDLAADLGQVQALLDGRIDRYRMEKRYLRRDRSIVWVLLTVSLVDPRIPGGEPFFVSVVEDISALKAARSALEASERRYRFLAETIPQIVWSALPDGRLDYFNRRWTELIGRPVEAGTGEGWAEVIHPDDLPAMQAAWAQALATGGAYQVEHRACDRDGRWRWFRTSAAPLRGADGGIEMWVGTAVDFQAEREALEEVRRLNAALERRVAERTAQLADANAELEAFAYSVAHDLRAPLRGMQGFSRALLEEYGAALDETGRDYAGRIARGAAHLDNLIHDLLAYSRLSREEVRLGPVSLESVASGVLRSLEAELGAALSRVTVERPLPVVRGHPAVLTQVLANLVGNALKFVAPGSAPRVTIRAEDRHGTVRVLVEDNGIGIRPEHQEKVFRVFERLHGQRAYPGTGIGLAIVKKGIERLGGCVGVDSEPGRGSRFWFELPKEPPDAGA
jgi:PAS domain S-box-containing protein